MEANNIKKAEFLIGIGGFTTIERSAIKQIIPLLNRVSRGNKLSTQEKQLLEELASELIHIHEILLLQSPLKFLESRITTKDGKIHGKIDPVQFTTQKEKTELLNPGNPIPIALNAFQLQIIKGTLEGNLIKHDYGDLMNKKFYDIILIMKESMKLFREGPA